MGERKLKLILCTCTSTSTLSVSARPFQPYSCRIPKAPGVTPTELKNFLHVCIRVMSLFLQEREARAALDAILNRFVAVMDMPLLRPGASGSGERYGTWGGSSNVG